MKSAVAWTLLATCTGCGIAAEAPDPTGRIVTTALAHNRGGGADIEPMKGAGVPQISLRQDGARDFDYHHSAADTLDKVKPDLSKNVAALAVLAYALADREDVLARVPPAATSAPK